MSNREAGSGNTGLTKRVVGQVSVALDEDRPAGQRLAAGLRVAGGSGATVVAGVLGEQFVNRFDPSALHALVGMVPGAGIGAGAGALAVGVISISAGMSIEDAWDRSAKRTIRNDTGRLAAHVRDGSMIGGLVAGIAAGGLDASNALGVAHTATLGHLAVEGVAVATGIAVVSHVASRLWRIGIPKPERAAAAPKALTE